MSTLQTVQLKIHRPSGRKIDVMDVSLQRYAEAFRFLLADARARLPEIVETVSLRGLTRLNVIHHVKKETMKELNRFNVQPFKDALLYELSMLLLSHLKRIRGKDGAFTGAEIGFPVVQESHSLLFSRYDEKRGYCLLFDYHCNRWYARLQLLPVGDPLRSPRLDTSNCDFDVVGYERPPLSVTSAGAILVPLSFGKQQLLLLEKAKENLKMLRMARLVKRGADFYLDVCLKPDRPEPLEIRSEMGIVRSLDGDVHMTVTDLTGKVLASSLVSVERNCPERLHLLANVLLAIASRHHARVILQSFHQASDKLLQYSVQLGAAMPPLSVGEYNHLAELLSRKLVRAGLEKPIRVGSNRLFHLCGVCGAKRIVSLPDSRLVMCTHCGSVSDPLYAGSRQILARLAGYRARSG